MGTRKNHHKHRFRIGKILGLAAAILFGMFIALAVGAFALYRYLEPQLPDIESLSDVRYQIPMSIYSKDGLLIAQFGEKKRSPITVAEVPKPVIQAFLAAEDNRFFDHLGVDYQGLLRATFSFLRTGEKKQGGSTITMQVARNFFLTSEKTFFRKVKEILLAIEIESKLPKERILELYLNKIYFGHHAYGIVAAAQVYYGRAITDLDLSEIAMIAGLPKAPSSFNPIVNPERALERRNYVLGRMRKLRFIDEQQFKDALAKPVTTTLHTQPVEMDAPELAEMVRNEMYQQFGDAAYTNGYRVYVTIDSHLQAVAEHALRTTLHEYDERHGYRGVTQHLDIHKVTKPEEWDQRLAEFTTIGMTLPGLVTMIRDNSATVYLDHGTTITLDWDGIRWARKYINENTLGRQPRNVREVLKPGDLIRVQKDQNRHWRLAQIPKAEAALVSLEPKTGALVALVGGYDFQLSKFNRATQAQRQPGSGFKPVLYAAALADGYTPMSIINDAPISYADPSQSGGVWRPQNYSGRFYGPTRLRVALAKSRNLVSVRLLKNIGLKKAIDTAIQFGFQPDELPHSLPLALGAGTATPLRMAQAFAAFANGGFRIEPYLIDRIETSSGQIVYQATPQTACIECDEPGSGEHPANLAPRVMSPQVHYMMNSMLQDVINRGTATKAKALGRPDIAGKTGTTNDHRDAWFNGYSPTLVAVAWIGFDSFKPLGNHETGGTTALPMWMDYMREALKNVPESSFPLPNGLTTARIDPSSGSLTSAGNPNATFEVFPSGQGSRRGTARAQTEGEAEQPSEASERGGTDEDLATDSPDSEPAQAPGEKSLESLF